MTDSEETTLIQGNSGRGGSSPAIDALFLIIFLGIGGIGTILHPYAMGSRIPGDLADSRFNSALLEFFYRSLLAVLHGRPGAFLDAPFFYPWPRVTNFSDTFWGDAEVFALARSFGEGTVRSFQVWFVAGFLLTYAATFVSFRRLGLAAWGAASGAFMFTFPLPMAAQFDHVQLVYRLWVPVAILAFHRFFTRRSPRAGAACILFVALQLLAGIYLGLFLCLLLASYAVALCFVGRRRLVPSGPATFRPVRSGELVMTAALLMAAVIILTIVGRPYLDVQAMYGFTRAWPEVAQMLPRPGSYLLASASMLWPNLSSSFSYPALQEHQLFPGLSAIIPVVWFMLSKRARARHPLAGVMLVTLAILFSLTIYVDGRTLYRFIFLIPGFSSIRAVARVILVMMLPLAALFGLLMDDLAAPGPHRLVRRCVASVLSAFLVVECSWVVVANSTPADWQARLDALEARLPKTLPPHAILAVAGPPFRSADAFPWALTQTDAEVAAVGLGISTLNGYSGNQPPTWSTLTTCGDVEHDIRAGQHFLAEHGFAAPDIEPEQIVLVGFGHCEFSALGHDPLLQIGHSYRFAEGADGTPIVGGGLSGPESWGRWTDANEAFLYFSLAASIPGPTAVEISARAFSSLPDRRQEVTVEANTRDCGHFEVSAKRSRAQVVCPPGAFGIGNNVLRFGVARPARPIDLGVSNDWRRLGLGLEALTLRPLD